MQTLSDSTVWIDTPTAIDTVFYGVNTTFNVGGGNYTLNNGEITFSATGDYTVQISNPALLDGQVQQRFTVQQGTGIDAIHKANPLAAWMQNGMLHVSGLTAGKSWSVYDVTGIAVYQSIANSSKANIPLPARGVYFVRSDNKVIKVRY